MTELGGKSVVYKGAGALAAGDNASDEVVSQVVARLEKKAAVTIPNLKGVALSMVLGKSKSRYSNPTGILCQPKDP